MEFLKIAKLHEQEEMGKHRVERRRLSASRGSDKCFAIERSSRNCPVQQPAQETKAPAPSQRE